MSVIKTGRQIKRTEKDLKCRVETLELPWICFRDATECEWRVREVLIGGRAGCRRVMAAVRRPCEETGAFNGDTAP
ncbi:hypothetical protein Baya_17040 [Bagarius yarrelli]|uniref:Uncharacterized protein n=1 Tax=Bagarius yarrelli TaxID=175774 RepID=A0A556VXA4_BAGYA|nr:hypothetical protein Baya_17040 [Bagarius yarrelli]